MIRTALVVACLGLGLSAVMAQPDPIAERRNTMKAVGGATREGAAIAKGEVPFDAAKAQAIFKIYADAAAKMPTLYPESAKTGGDTSASPKIWEDKANFDAAFAKFGEEAKIGMAATDLAGFRSAFGAATKSCGTCHEAYRVKR
jgi:cytochrome c556